MLLLSRSPEKLEATPFILSHTSETSHPMTVIRTSAIYNQEKRFLWKYLSIQVAIETCCLYIHASHLLLMLLHAGATYLRFLCLFLSTLFAAFAQTPSSFHILPVLFSLATKTKSYQSITLLLDH